MSLKFEDIGWTKKPELLLRWYPKWQDLRRILQAAIIAEGNPNNWYSSELDQFIAEFDELEELIIMSLGATHEASCCPG